MPDGILPTETTAPELAAETADNRMVQHVRRNLVLWSAGTTLVILLILAGVNYLVLTVYDEAWALPASAEAPLSGKLLGASALVLSIGVMYFGRMLPFIGNAF